MRHHKQWLAALCHRFHVSAIYAFGSRSLEVKQWADNDMLALNPDSSADVDIGIKLDTPYSLTIRQKIAFAQALEAKLQIMRVDLALLDETDPFLALNIIRGARLYAKDNDAADNYELYIMRRAGDLAPFERQRMKMILGVAP